MAFRPGNADADAPEEHHEINVTPFIDVMLVLLIIFMVAAPLSTMQVPVDLPAIDAEPPPRDRQPVFLTLQADLTLSLGERRVSPGELAPALDAATGGDHDERIFLRADASVPYGEIMRTMQLLRDARYLKVALVGADAASEG